MREGRGLFYTACVEVATRHRRARGGGQVRRVAMLGSSCSSRGGRDVKSPKWDGVCGPGGALGVGVAPSERSVAAVTSAKAKPDASSRRAAAQPQRRARVRKVQARSKPQVVNDGDGTSMQQRRVDAARSEGARALPERDGIAKAQAAERARQQAVARSRSIQLQAERGAAAERQHAQKRARIEAAKQAKQAAAAERKRDADALRAAERAGGRGGVCGAVCGAQTAWSCCCRVVLVDDDERLALCAADEAASAHDGEGEHDRELVCAAVFETACYPRVLKG